MYQDCRFLNKFKAWCQKSVTCMIDIAFGQVIIEMTDGGVDRSIECTGNVQAMISAFECVHDVITSHSLYAV